MVVIFRLVLFVHSSVSSSVLLPGEAEQAGLPQPVPLQRLLRLRQAEGAGVQEHRLDRRVHRPAAPRQDRQLHSYLLSPVFLPPSLPHLIFPHHHFIQSYVLNSVSSPTSVLMILMV